MIQTIFIGSAFFIKFDMYSLARSLKELEELIPLRVTAFAVEGIYDKTKKMII